MLSGYAKREWLTILAIGLMLSSTCVVVGWYVAAAVIIPATIALMAFFRDPDRAIPSERGVVLSPADGRVSSIHRVDHYEPFGGPAQCVRVFLSVFDVHVTRCPCHCRVASLTYKPGRHMNVLNPASAEANESLTVLLHHPIRRSPVIAVRLVAGMIARTISCAAAKGLILQRGQRFGIIKFGSTVELYVPESLRPQVRVQKGQRVVAGVTPLAAIVPLGQQGAAPVPETPSTELEPGEPLQVHSGPSVAPASAAPEHVG